MGMKPEFEIDIIKRTIKGRCKKKDLNEHFAKLKNLIRGD